MRVNDVGWDVKHRNSIYSTNSVHCPSTNVNRAFTEFIAAKGLGVSPAGNVILSNTLWPLAYHSWDYEFPLQFVLPQYIKAATIQVCQVNKGSNNFFAESVKTNWRQKSSLFVLSLYLSKLVYRELV